MNPVDKNRALNIAAKKIAPIISRSLVWNSSIKFLRLFDIYFSIIQGKGSGTGWDHKGEISAALCFIKSSEPLLLDIGANVGEWSKLMQDHFGPSCKIFMFEPSRYCQEELKKLSLPTATLVPCAVGEEPGVSTLFYAEPGWGAASLVPRRDSYFSDKEIYREEVKVATIDNFVAENNIDNIDFMKMDIEGYELFALKGALKSLSSGRIKALSFEFGSSNINSRTYFHDLWDILKPHRYNIFRICPGGRLIEIKEYYEDLEYFRGASNYIAARN